MTVNVTWSDIVEMSRGIEAHIAEGRYLEAGDAAKIQFDYLSAFFASDAPVETAVEDIAAGIEQIEASHRAFLSRIEADRSKLGQDVSRARAGTRAMKRYAETR